MTATAEAPAQGRDGLSPRAQHVLAAVRSTGGAWVSPRQIRDTLAQDGEPMSGSMLRKHVTVLLGRGLIEATGSNADRRLRVPGGEGGGSGWGGAEIAAPLAKKNAAAPVNLTVVRRRVLHELCYRRHDVDGLAATLCLERDVVAGVVAGLLAARLICCTDHGRYAVKG